MSFCASLRLSSYDPTKSVTFQFYHSHLKASCFTSAHYSHIGRPVEYASLTADLVVFLEHASHKDCCSVKTDAFAIA